jgi:hypothetical protein
MNDVTVVVDLEALPPLSPGTRAAIANLVDYAIERARGENVDAEIGGATVIATAGLRLDLRAQYLEAGYANAGVSLGEYVAAAMRAVVEDGVRARTGQVAPE